MPLKSISQSFYFPLTKETKCVTQIFADDTKIFPTIKFQDDLHKLQTDLDNIGLRADQWQIKFDTSKFKIIHFGKIM